MKVLCIDDHALFREGLALLMVRLFDGVRVLHADSCEVGLSVLDAHPDLALILLDLRLPRHLSGKDGITLFRQAAPAVPLVVVSGDEDPDVILECVDKGAMGYIPKSVTTSVLLSALRLVLDGHPYVPTNAVRRLSDDIHSTSGHSAESPVPHFTAREEEVLALMMRGMQNKLIADRLGITSEGTVKQHVSAVLAKLNVRNRTQAVVKAVALGLRPAFPSHPS